MKLVEKTRISAAALALLSLSALSTGFLEATPAFAKDTQQRPAVLNASAVAVADKYAADAAEQIFKEGGNAVDAAVAIAFSLAVTYPEAGNIGGGGFMTLYVNGKPYFLDYRERAPLAATRTMYQDDKGNVIPGKAMVSLDVRHERDFVRRTAVKQLLENARAIAERRWLGVQHQDQLEQPAVPMDERLTSFVTDAIEAAGLPLKHMTSGAGHDAMVLAARVPTTMLFLRSPGGLSHHPDETVREEDVEAALGVGRYFLERVAAEIR